MTAMKQLNGALLAFFCTALFMGILGANNVEAPNKNVSSIQDKASDLEVKQEGTEGAVSVQEEGDPLAQLLAMLAPQEQGGEKGSIAPMSSPDIKDFLMNIVQEQMRKQALAEKERREKLLAVLPMPLAETIGRLNGEYQNLVQSITVGNALVEVCVSARHEVEQLTIDKLLASDVSIKLSGELALFHEALISGSFNRLLKEMIPPKHLAGMNAAQVDLQSMFMGMSNGQNLFELGDSQSYEIEKLEDLFELIEQCISQIGKDAKGAKHIYELQAALQLLYDNKPLQFIEDSLAKIEPRCIKVLAEIKEVTQELNKSFEELKGVTIKEWVKEFRRKMAEEANAPKDVDVSAKKEKEEKSEGEASLGKALLQWYSDFKKYEQTLTVFFDLKRSVDLSDGEKSITFNRHIAHFSTMVLDFLNLSHRDALGLKDSKGFFDPRSLKPYLMNMALRASLSAWHFSNVNAQMNTGGYLKIALGESSVAANSYLQFLVSRWGAVAMALPVFFNPTMYFRSESGIVRGLSKVAVAWSYYHLCHDSLFKKGKNDVINWWPNEYDTMIQRLKGAAGEVTDTIYSEVAWKIRMHADPHTLEKAERYSWGIIKPEMISTVLDSFIPYFFLKCVPEGVAKSTRKNMYASWFHRENRDRLISFVKNNENKNHALVKGFKRDVGVYYQRKLAELKKAEGFKDDSERDKAVQRYQRHNLGNGEYSDSIMRGYANRHVNEAMDLYQEASGIDVDLIYIEQKVFDYAASSIGNYWGRRFARHYRKQITGGVSRVIDFFMDCCETVGFVSPDFAEGILADKDALFSDVNAVVEFIKGVAVQAFDPLSPIRGTLYTFLVQYGYVDKEETDHNEINRSLMMLVLNELVRHRVLDNASSAEIIQTFDTEVFTDDYEDNEQHRVTVPVQAVNLLIEGIKDGMIAFVGGHVGSVIGSKVGDQAYHRWGPFYPKVKRMFASSDKNAVV